MKDTGRTGTSAAKPRQSTARAGATGGVPAQRRPSRPGRRETTFAVPVDAEGLRRLSPTDIAQYARLDQCERYLRLQLHDPSAHPRFMAQEGVAPQAIPPLLTRSGRRFETATQAAMSAHFPSTDCAAARGGDRADTNDQVTATAAALAPGEAHVFFQPRLRAALAGWRVTGDVDVLLLRRDADGALRALIADIKSSIRPKVEHRLQVALYHELLGAVLAAHGQAAQIDLGVLYRGSADGAVLLDPEARAKQERDQQAAEERFGLIPGQGLLEVLARPEDYLGAVADLVTGPEAAARRIAEAPFADMPFHLSPKCDGCIFAEFCLKRAAETDDLSLLPGMNDAAKGALRRSGVETNAALARLKVPRREEGGSPRLETEPAQAATVRQLTAAAAIGPRLDELIHRARRFRADRGDDLTALSYIPNSGDGSLPHISPELNPNLVRVYLDAQHDHVNDRIWLLGALVVGYEAGIAGAERRRTVVRMADGPPESLARERALFLDWVTATLRAIGEVAAPDAAGQARAPIHLVFYDAREQRQLLDGLARHAETILGATPLYDFLTQLAAFDSPITTFLDREIRERQNYPLTCPSLQSVATYLRFDWGASPDGHPFRELFRTRLFDSLGRLEEATDGAMGAFYQRRPRFSSSIPLEYAYAAWGELPPPTAGQRDESGPYRVATPPALIAFQGRRLAAMEHIARQFRGNDKTALTPFDLPDLLHFEDAAGTLAEALDEFVTIERHVALGAWKGERQAAPEQRLVAGQSLLVQYREEEQLPGVAAANQEHHRRWQRRAALLAERQTANPSASARDWPKAEREATTWTWDGLRFRLRLVTDGADADLDELLGTTELKAGDSLVLFRRWTFDTRLPVERQRPLTPTAKQLLYGVGATLEALTIERDAGGAAVAAWAELAIESRPGTPKGGPPGFLFGTPSWNNEPLIEGDTYTLEPEPNDWYGYWCKCLTGKLVAGGPNTLYDRLATPAATADWPEAAAAGQARFLAGLDSLHAAGALHGFEPGKRGFIGGHGETPTLLVQGPPGTGKSYSTAFAVLARAQGAMAAGRPYRVVLACKTHAATDVLLRNVQEAQAALAALWEAQPELCAAHFDRRLLSLPLFRQASVRTHTEWESVTLLRPKSEAAPGQPRAAESLLAVEWCVLAATPGGVNRIVRDRWGGQDLCGHELVDALVLDEASQMNLPEAALAALLLKPAGQLIVVGDHRQMPPILQHDWAREARRTFRRFRSFDSLFQALLDRGVPVIRFAESFRLHADMADFLRQQVYAQDGIPYHSHRVDTLPALSHTDPFLSAVLNPCHPIVVVVHNEAESQQRNSFEERLLAPVLAALADPTRYNLDPRAGLGVVVPHRAQRAALQAALPQLRVVDPATGAITLSAVDTVERFQGDERTVVVVGATESDRDYLLGTAAFLLDPRRLTVALSRAKQKMILVASQTIFGLVSTDEETFANAQLWKNLRRQACTVPLWAGHREGVAVEVWGNSPFTPVVYPPSSSRFLAQG